ncbi:MAG: potassium channel protein [Calditrichaeota bacterium]|nr:MAG: potassium channel protein [Calditrichota bacterium]
MQRFLKRPLRFGLSWWSNHLTPFKRILVAGGLFFLVLVVGSAGYMLIEGWAPLESLYMTVITLSTVGFQEVRPLSGAGRLFTSALIIMGIGTVGYGFGHIAAFFVEGELRNVFRIRRMEKIIGSLRNHIIICGYGVEGRHAGEELQRSGVPFVVIEKDTELAEKLREEGRIVIPGDATHDDVLSSAGVAVAKGLIAALSDDAENVFVTLTARGFNPDLMIVARASDEKSVAKLFRAGASKVISSAEIGGRRMASMLLRPQVVNFLDVIMSDPELALRLEEIDIEQGSALVGRSIRDLEIRGRTGAMVIAYHREGQPIHVNPPPDSVLQAGDVLIVMGTDSQVAQLCRIASESAR